MNLFMLMKRKIACNYAIFHFVPIFRLPGLKILLLIEHFDRMNTKTQIWIALQPKAFLKRVEQKIHQEFSLSLRFHNRAPLLISRESLTAWKISRTRSGSCCFEKNEIS